jgi:phospho-N-acetylmuramoyl-pentapeptide-transferase
MLYLFCALIYVVGYVNAVNLTDGIDGLVSGMTIPVALFFALVSLALAGMLTPGATADLLAAAGVPASFGIFAAALAGGLAGFLIYNFNPAKVFMGDTGSLFLGGALCGLAFACDMPLILIPVGLIYLIEMFSVMLQVIWFKLSGGKRLFKMAPIHHHFEMCGWKEKKIFTVFVTLTIILCAITFISVCQKYLA